MDISKWDFYVCGRLGKHTPFAVRLWRILKRPEVLPISPGSKEYNRHGTYCSHSEKWEGIYKGRSGSSVLMSKHRFYAGSLSEERQQEGKNKPMSSPRLLSSKFNIQITIKKSSERRYFLKWVLFCTLNCVWSPSSSPFAVMWTQWVLRLPRKYCSPHCPTPDRHNGRGRPDVILCIHTILPFIAINTSASSPSAAGWSPTNPPSSSNTTSPTH